jgi:hypothetical protein
VTPFEKVSLLAEIYSQELTPITIQTKNHATQHKVPVALARTNTRSDWVVLDFLLLLHQGKRRGKTNKLAYQ